MNIDAKKIGAPAPDSRAIEADGQLEREALSAQARAILCAQPVWLQAQAILFYAPQEGRVGSVAFGADGSCAPGKRVLLPRYQPEVDAYSACEIHRSFKDLLPGRYSIPEPAPHCPPFLLKPLDLLLVPGVAFDLLGRRLGRGRGYYDKMLATLSGVRCGVGFDEQIVSEIPVAPHDAYLNCILTPTRWLQF